MEPEPTRVRVEPDRTRRRAEPDDTRRRAEPDDTRRRAEPDRSRRCLEPDRSRRRGDRDGPDRDREILARVSATPVGFVRTYGDVSPGAPRVAGGVLHDCHDPAVPWHRIVRADGSLAKGDRQRSLLLAEGVPFRGKRVDMRVARLPDL